MNLFYKYKIKLTFFILSCIDLTNFYVSENLIKERAKEILNQKIKSLKILLEEYFFVLSYIQQKQKKVLIIKNFYFYLENLKSTLTVKDLQFIYIKDKKIKTFQKKYNFYRSFALQLLNFIEDYFSI